MTIARLCPCERVPVSKAPGAVAVCWAASLLVQVTESPTFTVTEAGTKRKVSMLTAAEAASDALDSARTLAIVVAASAIRLIVRALIARTIIRVPTMSAPFEALARDASRIGLALSPEQLVVCERLAAELIERNTNVNLTAITDPAGIATKHFLDSFTALAVREWSGRERVVDVGSGAGFPGLALRIALPGSSAALVESVTKKCTWLREISTTLDLDRVSVHNARAEVLGGDEAHRARYDVGTARAVSSLADCIEYLVPLLVLGGEAIVWKGRVDEELPAASRAAAEVGAEITSVTPTSSLGLGEVLPGRHLIVVRKTGVTPPRFPRTSQEMRRRPW